jgi:hypothetical protein
MCRTCCFLRGRSKPLLVLFVLTILLGSGRPGFCENTPSVHSGGKAIRLHVIALGMKDNPRGLRGLQEIADAGGGKFTTADDFKALEEAFRRVAVDTSTAVVRWPRKEVGAPTGSVGQGRIPSPWSDLWVQRLSALLITLIVLTGVTAYLKFRPENEISILEQGDEPRRIILKSNSLWIGRDRSCRVILKDPYVSKRHLKAKFKQKGLWYRDNDTENGSFVQGKKVKEGLLPYGKEITIGKSKLHFQKKKYSSR